MDVTTQSSTMSTLLLNTPVPVGMTLRCRCNSRRFEAGVPEKNFPNRTMHGWKGIRRQAISKKQLWLQIPKGISPKSTYRFPTTYVVGFFCNQWL